MHPGARGERQGRTCGTSVAIGGGAPVPASGAGRATHPHFPTLLRPAAAFTRPAQRRPQCRGASRSAAATHEPSRAACGGVAHAALLREQVHRPGHRTVANHRERHCCHRTGAEGQRPRAGDCRRAATGRSRSASRAKRNKPVWRSPDDGPAFDSCASTRTDPASTNPRNTNGIARPRIRPERGDRTLGFQAVAGVRTAVSRCP